MTTQKERFELLLEHIETKLDALADGILSNNERLNRIEGRLERIEEAVM